MKKPPKKPIKKPKQVKPKQKYAKNYFNHLVAFVLLGLLAVVWSWVFFINASEISPSEPLNIIFSIFVFLANVSITAGVFFLAWRFFRKAIPNNKVLLLVKIALVWAAVEFLASFIVSIVWIGTDSSWDTVLPFASFTPILMYTPLGYLARLVGYHGLSALFVLCISVLLIKKLRKFVLPVYCLIALLTFGAYTFYEDTSGETVSVATTAEIKGEQRTISTESEVLVLPEYGLDNLTEDEVDEKIVSSDNVYFIGSKQRPANGRIYNSLVFGSTEEGFIKQKDKSRLVPAGEYLPYVIEFPLKMFYATETLEYFESVRGTAKGQDDNTQPIYIRDEVVLGSAVCSSIISTKDYRQMTNRGATLLTNSASLEIFDGSRIFSIQHKGMSRFMAVANARPLVQSSNDGDAYIIDHNGDKLIQTAPVNTIEKSIQTNTKLTPYTVLGEWLVVLGMIYIAGTFIKALIINNQRFKHLKR